MCGLSKLVAACVVSSEIKAQDGIELVVMLVKVEQATAVESAITVLINMSVDDQLCVDIVDFNVIPALIQALSFQSVVSTYSQYHSNSVPQTCKETKYK